MSCPTGKIEHLSRKAAEAHAESIFKKDGHLPNIYICPDCNCLHVGGGRKSDQPLRIVKQQSTPWRERLPKPASGKVRTVDDLILYELVNTFKNDYEIARQFEGKGFWHVQQIRYANDIPKAKKREVEAALALIKQYPLLCAREIGERLKIKGWRVTDIAKAAGLTLPKNKRIGINAPNWGNRDSEETLALKAEKQRQAWLRNPNRKKGHFSVEDKKKSEETQRLPYMRERRKNITKRNWQKPEVREKIIAGLKRPRKSSIFLDKDVLAEKIESGLIVVKIAAIFNVKTSLIYSNIRRYWGTEKITKVREILRTPMR
jgi:hypothetical protein